MNPLIFKNFSLSFPGFLLLFFKMILFPGFPGFSESLCTLSWSANWTIHFTQKKVVKRFHLTAPPQHRFAHAI